MWMIGRFMEAQTYNNEILLTIFKCILQQYTENKLENIESVYETNKDKILKEFENYIFLEDHVKILI